MKQLLQTFVDIALWRKGPQDLPASRFLVGSVLAIYIAMSFVQARLFKLSLDTAVLIVGIDVLMLTGWLWVVLAFFGRKQRFVQTATAVLGVGVLLCTLDIFIRIMQLAANSGEALPDSWVLLRFLALALILGRIFMHALDRGLLTGMALTIAIIYSTHEVAQLMLQGLSRSG